MQRGLARYHRSSPRTRRQLVVFEFNKSSNRQSDDRDFEKLNAYDSHLGYVHGVFIRFAVGPLVPDVIRAEFVYSE